MRRRIRKSLQEHYSKFSSSIRFTCDFDFKLFTGLRYLIVRFTTFHLLEQAFVVNVLTYLREKLPTS